MTISEINALTIESTIFILMSRLLDPNAVPPGEAMFTIGDDDSVDFYERVAVNDVFVKPHITTVNDELDAYKAELTAEENARLAEIARVQAIQTRVDAINSLNGAMFTLNPEIANARAEVNRIIKEDDIAFLEQLEAKGLEFDAKQASDVAKETRKTLGANARLICAEVLDIVAGYNIERSATAAEKDAMEVTYGPILQALSVNRPMKAKPLIEAIPVDAVVTQEMKDEILEVYTKNGL